uniref:Uncharacterized protein n=1 Tax=Tanacetum cinerariifolium TaxID=118510 RepID=A0A6L2KXH6_TANCI|nr:hypothetical protein [Tanacetum cinerariifolium]
MLSSLDVLQGFSFFLQMGLTLILATFDGLNVGLLGDVIGENDYDDDGRECIYSGEKVIDLEEVKIAQAKKTAKLKKRVKKLEKRRKSRRAGLERLKKGRNIKDIDQDAEIELVDEAQGRMHDEKMFRVDDLEGNEVFVDVREKTVEKEVSSANPVTTAGKVVTAVSVEDSAAPTTATTADVDDELTLPKTLIAIKAAKPKVISTAITTPKAKGIVFYEQVQAHKPTVYSSKDKGKAKMIKHKKPLKKKDQIRFDEEVARKLEAEMRAKIKEEEMIAREKDKKGNNYPLKKDLSFWQSLLNQGESILLPKELKRSGTSHHKEDSFKRAGQELEQESTKKQKLAEQEQDKVADDDTAELKRCLEIVHEDDDDVAIEATPISSKSPTIKKMKPKRKQRHAAKVHSPSNKILIEESVPTLYNDPLPSGEDSIQLNELMIFCTSLQQQVLDLEEAKIAQAKEIDKLKKRVKKLEKRRKSRPIGLRRLTKGRNIEDTDQYAEIALVDEAQGRMHDAKMFGVDDLEGNEVFVDVREKTIKKEVSTVDPVTTAGEVVTVDSVEDSAAPTTATTANVDGELTLANTLIAIKAAKPKFISTAITTPRAKGIIFHEQVQAHKPTVSSSKDKGKVEIIEPEKPLKNKNQIAFDKEVERKLEAEMRAEMEEEERIARE